MCVDTLHKGDNDDDDDNNNNKNNIITIVVVVAYYSRCRVSPLVQTFYLLL
jgi:hypothetical protein